MPEYYTSTKQFIETEVAERGKDMGYGGIIMRLWCRKA